MRFECFGSHSIMLNSSTYGDISVTSNYIHNPNSIHKTKTVQHTIRNIIFIWNYLTVKKSFSSEFRVDSALVEQINVIVVIIKTFRFFSYISQHIFINEMFRTEKKRDVFH